MDYFYLQEADQFNFIQVPMLLFTNPFFKDLSSDAKLLYGLLLSRMSLSRKNGWIDEEGRVYINYPVEEVQETMNCSNKTAIKILKELDSKKGLGLIEKRRLGLGKSNVIYVKNFSTAEDLTSFEKENDEANTLDIKDSNFDESGEESVTFSEVKKVHFLKCKNYTSENVESTLPEVKKSHSKYINNKYINNKYNNQSIYQREVDEKIQEEMDRWTEMESDLILSHRGKQGVIREIIEIAKDIILSDSEVVFSINGQKVSALRVQDKLKKLEYSDIELLLDKLEENRTKIVNIRHYIIAMLYNSCTNLYFDQLFYMHQNS